jgi:hypothetical protein
MSAWDERVKVSVVPSSRRARALAAALALVVAGCTAYQAPPPASPPPTAPPADVHAAFLANLAQQCGQAFAGTVLDVPPGDESFAGDPPLIMHIRECSPDEVRIPVHVGADRSRMWIFTRTGGGIDLRHDHRHADGRSEPETFYGAFVADPPLALQPPTPNRHEFKWDRDGIIVGWVVEIVPGERYTYGTQRDGVWRHRFEFDLSRPVAPPPDPWGHAPVGQSPVLAGPHAAFMASLAAHCGQAFHGSITRRPPTDRIFRGDEVLTVHFRECDEGRLKLPFHVEADRSRTWIVSATTAGIDLRHDHRHEDGTPEENTWYGAHTQAPGSAQRQEFLRETAEGVTRTGWAIEIVPQQRYTYGTIRDGEWTYRLDFDLTRPVTPPPPPWGHERR